MNPSAIFSKTGKGVQEASGKTSHLSRADRNVLKEIDGKTPLADVAVKFEKLSADKFDALIQQLDKDGFIREVSSGAAEPAAPPRRFTAPPPRTPPPASRAAPPPADDGEVLDFTQAIKLPPKGPAVDLAAASHAEAERKAKEQAFDYKARQEAEAKAKAEAEAKARAEAEARARAAAAEAKARAEAEDKAREAAEAKSRAESEARVKAAREAAMRLASEAKAKTEAAEQRARKEAEERARLEAEMKARLEEERKAREEAERRAAEAAEQARKELEQKARREAEEMRQRLEAEMQAKLEEERRKREEEEKKRRQEEEQRRAKEEAERRARDEAERKRREEEDRKRREEDERRRKEEQERRAREEQERQRRAKEDEERRARDEQDRKRRDEDDRKRREEDDRRRREETERRAGEEAEAKASAAAAAARSSAQPAIPAPAQPAAADPLAGLGDSLLADLDSFSQRDEEERKAKEEAERKEKEAAARRAREEEERRRREEEDRRRREEEEERNAKAEAEAERRAREEEERREREEEEERKQAETERKREAKEALAAKEAEEKAARSAASARSAAKGDDDVGVTDEDLDMDDVKRDEKALSKEARRREAERMEPVVAAKVRRPVNWGKPAAVALFVILIGGVGALNVMPVSTAEYEKAASEALGVPVKISSARLSALTSVEVRLEGVSIGDAVKVRLVRGSPEIGSLFGAKKVFSRIELEGASASQAQLGEAAFGKVGSENFRVGRIVMKQAKFDGPLALPALDIDAKVAGDGTLQSIALSGPDKLAVRLAPKGNELEFEISAASLALPFAPAFSLSEFGMKGTATRQGVSASDFDGRAFDGVISGKARIGWGATWSAEGELRARGVKVAVFAPTLVSEGKVEANGKYTMSGPDPAKLYERARLDGSFKIDNGVIGNFNLRRALETGGAQTGGRTEFAELTGQGVYERGSVQLRNIAITAGAMSAGASLDIDASGALLGRIAADVKTPNQTLRAVLNISGKLQDPVIRK